MSPTNNGKSKSRECQAYHLECRGSRAASNGDIRATVVLVNDEDREVFRDQVNLSSLKARNQFDKQLRKQFPDLTGKDVEGQLLELLRNIPVVGKKSDDDDQPQAQVLVKLAKGSGHEFFHDGSTPFVAMEREDHREVWPIRSLNYKRWLGRAYWETQNEKVPNGEALSAALNVLEGFAMFDGEAHALNNRVSWYGSDIYYDLTDEAWQAVRISPDHWEVCQNPPLIFQRHGHQLPQVEPVRGGDAREILNFIYPSSDHEAVLFLVYVASLFIPDIPHPIPIVHGDPGAGKSTIMRLIRKLVDPSELLLLSLPRDPQAAVQLLSHHWISFFDNVSSLPDWLSDMLCRACTGEGSSKRQLFTDDEDVIYKYKRCVGLNGVNIAAEKSDLLDRAILIHYQRLDADKLIEEKRLLGEFDEALEAILGGFFDIVARALVIKPSVNLRWRSRMVDFVTWGAAIAEAAGYTQEMFLQAYAENIKTQNEAVLASSLIATAILKFMDGREGWLGTPAELLSGLEPIAAQLKIATTSKGWPKSPVWLVRRLHEVRINLLAEGVSVEESHTNKRLLALLKVSVNTVFTDGNREADTKSGTSVYFDDTDGKTILPTVEPFPDSKRRYPTVSENITDVPEVEPTDSIDGIFTPPQGKTKTKTPDDEAEAFLREMEESR